MECLEIMYDVFVAFILGYFVCNGIHFMRIQSVRKSSTGTQQFYTLPTRTRLKNQTNILTVSLPQCCAQWYMVYT